MGLRAAMPLSMHLRAPGLSLITGLYCHTHAHVVTVWAHAQGHSCSCSGSSPLFCHRPAPLSSAKPSSCAPAWLQRISLAGLHGRAPPMGRPWSHRGSHRQPGPPWPPDHPQLAQALPAGPGFYQYKGAASGPCCYTGTCSQECAHHRLCPLPLPAQFLAPGSGVTTEEFNSCCSHCESLHHMPRAGQLLISANETSCHPGPRPPGAPTLAPCPTKPRVTTVPTCPPP